ncbi:MAG: IS1182 family transposase [Candidatus Rokuibacteriota bacterium]
MSKTFREWHVEQRWLLPPSLDEFVPEGHLAHFIRDLVRETLDLSAILDTYLEERGYPPYHPAMMTALLLYAYSQGIYASRRIARACEQRVDVMAVTGLQRPDFRTIATFRRRHLRALAGLFRQVLRLCRKAGLVTLGHVALDGTKLKANASKHKAMSYGRMKTREPELEQAIQAEVQKMLDRAEAEDAADDRRLGEEVRGDELPDHLRTKQQRLAAIRHAKAALEAEAREQAQAAGKDPHTATVPDKAQRNFTDPESRIQKTRDGFLQGYNAQAAVDAEAQVIVACELTPGAADVEHLPGLVEQIRQHLRRKPREVSADAGYSSDDNLQFLERKGIAAFIPSTRQKHTDLWLPAPRGRIPNGLTRRQRMARRLLTIRGRARYALRKITVEPVFGQVKQARGFRGVLLRGLEKARAEWTLVCTVHNLLKLFGCGRWASA